MTKLKKKDVYELFHEYRNKVLSHNAKVYLRDNDLWNGDPKPKDYDEKYGNEEGYMKGAKRMQVPRAIYSGNSYGSKHRGIKTVAMSPVHRAQWEELFGYPMPAELRVFQLRSKCPVQTTLNWEQVQTDSPAEQHSLKKAALELKKV